MQSKEFMETIMFLMITVIVPVISTYVGKYYDAKVEEIAKDAEKFNRQDLIIEAAKTIKEIVQSVNQTYVDSIKKAGSFDEVAQLNAKNSALEKAITLLGRDMREAITQTYSSLDEWLDIQIEKSVNELKK